MKETAVIKNLQDVILIVLEERLTDNGRRVIGKYTHPAQLDGSPYETNTSGF